MGAAGELRASRKRGSVDLCLEVSFEHVPVTDAHDDRPDREDNGDQEREENHDLAVLAQGPAANASYHVHVGPNPPVCSTGFCSSRIVALAVSVILMLLKNQNLYGAVTLTCTGSPMLGSSVVAPPGVLPG